MPSSTLALYLQREHTEQPAHPAHYHQGETSKMSARIDEKKYNIDEAATKIGISASGVRLLMDHKKLGFYQSGKRGFAYKGHGWSEFMGSERTLWADCGWQDREAARSDIQWPEKTHRHNSESAVRLGVFHATTNLVIPENRRGRALPQA